ncbi:Uncharacterised protein [Salmonella enterica subsp. enterica serovar Typhi]|nr:hypothetical protein SM222186_06596 [Salmonella enterica subsp. enterica serovar Typhi]AYS77028.1 hypothetical protein SM268103_06238 [Salmonella enterica subsp. enterica serovar Typhi]AYT59404.1 hypothetical protein SM213147_06319 [Salmonella enterica subsp. enterica serovar Typhi]AYT60953.1 hypothetical protein SM213147_06753 [Salmonella enterica subsp. enterica serovar Typhi]CFZ43033.1 Uncharacterised protein [Salmonella enterica subsp. enterica serovar Typhi]
MWDVLKYYTFILCGKKDARVARVLFNTCLISKRKRLNMYRLIHFMRAPLQR